MKKKYVPLLMLLFIVFISSIYRIIPGRPYGFDLQIALSIFAGSLFINNKKNAFLIPILGLFISDLMYYILFKNGFTKMNGFYEGQWINYVLMGLIPIFGFYINHKKITNFIIIILSAPTFYFLFSNFFVWIGGGGYQRPKTFYGLIQCLQDGIPFYKNSLIGTCIFSIILFGIYHFIKKPATALNK